MNKGDCWVLMVLVWSNNWRTDGKRVDMEMTVQRIGTRAG